MSQPSPSHGLGRRSLLKRGAALAGGALALDVFPRFAYAADAPIGNFPAGVAGNSVFLGISTPLTGSYSPDGHDLQLGYELAIAQINAGDPIARKWGIKDKGVLGKTIVYRVADSEAKPNVAVQAQTRFIQSDKAMMISGSVSSSEAIALEELAQREKILYMAGVCGSNDVTGKNCQRFGFRCSPSGFMCSAAVAPVLAKALGPNRKVAYLVPDYTYGHSLFESFGAFMAKHGWTQAAKEVVPLGTSDFSAALLNLANSDADVFCNIEFAGDAVASTKQAEQFGIFQKMKMVVPNLSSFQAKDTGPELMQGVYGAIDFLWPLQDRYPLAKDFVTSFEAANKYRPSWGAHVGYLQTYIWALSVERAGSFNPVDVIKVIEASKGQPYESTLGPVWYRAEDHQLVRPLAVVVGKGPSEMKSPDDYYTLLDVIPGVDNVPPLDKTGCKMGPII
jgi:ABC-type branched-subunit amino acid transport system substrate-binding protein